MTNCVGLFGKVPAHGDFVHRGWDDATTRGLDSWLADGLEQLRTEVAGDRLGAILTDAPLWQAFLPSGWLSPSALHIVLAPSVDSVGRYYFLAAGLVGAPTDLWDIACRDAGFMTVVEDLVYDALASRRDADAIHHAMVDRFAVLVAPPCAVVLSMPDHALFWAQRADGGIAAIRSGKADSEVVRRLILVEAA